MRIVNETDNLGENLDRMVGMRVRSVRRDLNISLASLADLVGVSVQKLHSYESGLTALNSNALFRIAAALDVSLADFIPTAAPVEQGEPCGLRGVV